MSGGGRHLFVQDVMIIDVHVAVPQVRFCHLIGMIGHKQTESTVDCLA